MMVKVAKKRKPRNYEAGLFDMDERLMKLTALGDPLVELKRMIDWEAFRGDIEKAREKERKSAAGAKPMDAVLMFKLETGGTYLHVAEIDLTNVPGLLNDERAFSWGLHYGCYLNRLRRVGLHAYESDPADCRAR